RVRVAGSSTLVYDRLQALKREIDQRNPSDPARRQLMAEHNALYDQYTARMDRLILEEPELQRRQVGSLHELISRGNAAERVWQAQQTRYPLARAERERVCAESRRAQGPADPLPPRPAWRPPT